MRPNDSRYRYDDTEGHVVYWINWDTNGNDEQHAYRLVAHYAGEVRWCDTHTVRAVSLAGRIA